MLYSFRISGQILAEDIEDTGPATSSDKLPALAS